LADTTNLHTLNSTLESSEGPSCSEDEPLLQTLSNEFASAKTNLKMDIDDVATDRWGTFAEVQVFEFEAFRHLTVDASSILSGHLPRLSQSSGGIVESKSAVWGRLTERRSEIRILSPVKENGKLRL
jgi:hypothetical protein